MPVLGYFPQGYFPTFDTDASHPALTGPLRVRLVQDMGSGAYDIVRRAGDALPEFTAVLQDHAGAVDLLGATMALDLTSQQTNQGPVTTSVTLFGNGATGSVSALWPHCLAPGDYLGVINVIWSDGTRASFPDDHDLRVLILMDF